MISGQDVHKYKLLSKISIPSDNSAFNENYWYVCILTTYIEM